uniref:Uncharacterized protein n=1 Tax=Leersia perrieri TaxID=77586 RepID=A0A0D9WPT1_9ORYZ
MVCTGVKRKGLACVVSEEFPSSIPPTSVSTGVRRTCSSNTESTARSCESLQSDGASGAEEGDYVEVVAKALIDIAINKPDALRGGANGFGNWMGGPPGGGFGGGFGGGYGGGFGGGYGDGAHEEDYSLQPNFQSSLHLAEEPN